MKRLLLAFLAISVAACAGDPTRPGEIRPELRKVENPGRPPIPRRDSLKAFVPLVPPVTGDAQCIGPMQFPDVEEFIYALRFDTTPSRVISLRLDVEGVPVNYNDLRGPVSMPGADFGPGDHTGIVIDLRREFVTLQNAPRDGEPDVGLYAFEGALDAENLDVPRRWIERVISQCAGGTP